jgi:hypothetical protein
MVESKLLKINCKTTYFEKVDLQCTIFIVSFTPDAYLFSARKPTLSEPQILQNVLCPLKIMEIKGPLRL